MRFIFLIVNVTRIRCSTSFSINRTRHNVTSRVFSCLSVQLICAPIWKNFYSHSSKLMTIDFQNRFFVSGFASIFFLLYFKESWDENESHLKYFMNYFNSRDVFNQLYRETIWISCFLIGLRDRYARGIELRCSEEIPETKKRYKLSRENDEKVGIILPHICWFVSRQI